MAINYKSLGATDSVRKRRYDILSYHVRNATPSEIAKALDVPIKTVYNDIEKMYESNLENVPLSIVRQMQESAFELKIRELEVRANRSNITDNAYNATQRLILDNRMASLKLMGLLSEKVELSGTVATSIEYVPVKKVSTDEKAD